MHSFFFDCVSQEQGELRWRKHWHFVFQFPAVLAPALSNGTVETIPEGLAKLQWCLFWTQPPFNNGIASKSIRTDLTQYGLHNWPYSLMSYRRKISVGECGISFWEHFFLYFHSVPSTELCVHSDLLLLAFRITGLQSKLCSAFRTARNFSACETFACGPLIN